MDFSFNYSLITCHTNAIGSLDRRLDTVCEAAAEVDAETCRFTGC